jgi:hypothetical protein
MMQIIQLNGQVHAAILGLFAAVLHGCTPLYVSDASITSTPRAQSLDAARLASEPVAVLGVVAPPSLSDIEPSQRTGVGAGLCRFDFGLRLGRDS